MKSEHKTWSSRSTLEHLRRATLDNNTSEHNCHRESLIYGACEILFQYLLSSETILSQFYLICDFRNLFEEESEQ